MKAEETDGHQDCGRTITVDTMSDDDDQEHEEEDENEDHRSDEEGNKEVQTEQQPKIVNSPQKHNLHHLNRWRVETNQLA